MSGEGPYAVPDYAEALLSDALAGMEDAAGEPWDVFCAGDYAVPGLVLRPFWWGPEDAPEAARPNFEFGVLKIWFYKYFGRGMSCNVIWTPAQWVDCYRALAAAIASAEDAA